MGFTVQLSANPLVLNDDCQTALEVARAKGHSNVVRAIEVHSNFCNVINMIVLLYEVEWADCFLFLLFIVIPKHLSFSNVDYCLAESSMLVLRLVAGVSWTWVSRSIGSSVGIEKSVGIT